ncbi:hypothetical protein BC628DRAFT_1417003 [Trametes gibbosa]|nr:hypothetical protein BC628DRAFT_1417003 [Trametes gibbosa]
MASGQLSPFPSCASGLGFLNSSDYRSATSLLTPAASVCTVSSLVHGGGGDVSDSGYSRVRTKTMQTKEILKSPQPHRFHLVPTGRRQMPSGYSPSSRPSAQLKDSWAGDAPMSPKSSEQGGNAEQDRQDLFSSAASPLLSPADIDNTPYSPKSPCAQLSSAHVVNDHEQLSPCTTRSPAFTDTSRPTSTGSALSVLTASASFTLVHDRGSKRLSCSCVNKKLFDVHYQKASVADEKPFSTAFILPDDHNSSLSNGDDCAPSVREPQTVHETMTAEQPSSSVVPHMILSDTSTSDVGEQTEASHTTSTSQDSLLSNYNSSSDYIDEDSERYTTKPMNTGIDPTPSLVPVSIPLPHSMPANTSTSTSPTKPPAPNRDRRKFALRRQAIYAEYGFQIALPDSDSDSSVKFLASSPGTKGRSGQGRAASAYVVSSSHSGRLHSALSASASGASSVEDASSHYPADGDEGDGDEDGRQLFGSAHLNDVDRFGRFSVQDSILGATRIPRLDDFADVTTSTPPRSARSRAASHRSLGTGLGLGFGSSPGASAGSSFDLDSSCGLGLGSSSGFGSDIHLSVTSTAIWQPGHSPHYAPGSAPKPLRLNAGQKRLPASQPKGLARESMCIPVSASERSARLSAWDFDPGHHPIVQDLLDEVDRALEQWRWIMKLRSYL